MCTRFHARRTPNVRLPENTGIVKRRALTTVRLVAICCSAPTRNSKAVVVGRVSLNRKTKTARFIKQTIRWEWSAPKCFAQDAAAIWDTFLTMALRQPEKDTA